MGCASQALKDHSFIFEFISKELTFNYKGLDERYGYEWHCLHVRWQPEFE
jgi:hypothetical protein